MNNEQINDCPFFIINFSKDLLYVQYTVTEFCPPVHFFSSQLFVN